MRILSFALILLVLSGAKRVNTVQQPEIEVVIKNIKSPSGVFVISFYNDPKSFPKPGKEVITDKIKVNDINEHRIKFKLPAEGWYAIALFQDEYETGKIKQDKIGVPLEPYAFSNNIRPKTAAPSFTACKFYVTAGNNTPQVINLIHPLFVKEK